MYIIPHPIVLADAEVDNGQVQAEGCCNYFRSAHKETQDEEHSEDASSKQEPVQMAPYAEREEGVGS